LPFAFPPFRLSSITLKTKGLTKKSTVGYQSSSIFYIFAPLFFKTALASNDRMRRCGPQN
jgi:hypothetical protein